MYLFSFLIYPAVIYLILDKADPKRLFDLLTGVVVSSILSVVFWSISTFYNPSSLSFFYDLINITFREYMVIILSSVYISLRIYSGKKLFNDYFLTGILIGITIFSVALNFSSNSAFIIFIQPILYFLYIFLFSKRNIYSFKKYDKLLKIIVFSVYTLLIVFLKLLFGNSLIVFAFVLIAAISIFVVLFIYRRVIFEKND